MSEQPTPEPWRALRSSGPNNHDYCIEADGHPLIARELTKADAFRIINAVNCHDELLGIIKAIEWSQAFAGDRSHNIKVAQE